MKDEHQYNVYRSQLSLILSNHRISHDFKWDDGQDPLHTMREIRKREFIEMLFLKRDGYEGINVKKDLPRYNKGWYGVNNYIN